MINVNEVRRGNLVKYDDRIFRIHTIAGEFPTLDTDEFGIGVVDWNNISPVELTEEWLIKLGLTNDCGLFELNDQIQNLCTGDLGKNCPNAWFNSRLDRWMDPQTRVCFDYVHQFQNLVFVLTSEELTIKLK